MNTFTACDDFPADQCGLCGYLELYHVGSDRVCPTARAVRVVYEGTPGWRAGIEASIKKVKYRQSVMADLQTPDYKQGLLDVLLHLEAMLERNTERSVSILD